MKKLATLVGAALASASLILAGPAAAASGGHGASTGSCHCAAADQSGTSDAGRIGTGGELPFGPVGEASDQGASQSLGGTHFTGGLF